jgi:heme/copper-type cytochrome/quinol oxidase subunit 2
MSRNQRFALLGIAVVILIGAFVISQSGGSDDKDTTATTSGTGTTPAANKPSETRIEVQKGKPVGGIHPITVKKGETVRLTVSSNDTSSEVHVHGYDFMKDVKPGQPAKFSFPAKIEGVFEVELEQTATQIAKLTVQPS